MIHLGTPIHMGISTAIHQLAPWVRYWLWVYHHKGH